jgi:hypothetical protein
VQGESRGVQWNARIGVKFTGIHFGFSKNGYKKGRIISALVESVFFNT